MESDRITSFTGWLRGEFGRLKLKQLRAVAAGLILAVAGLFGGLDTVNAGPKVFATDEPHSDGEFTLTVMRASVVDEVRAGRRIVAHAQPGQKFLGVVADVRNDGTIPGRLRGEMTLRDPAQNTTVGVFRIHDGSPATSLGPGLSEQLVFVWKVPDSDIHPDSEVTLRVTGKRFTELLVSYGRDWIDRPNDYAEITLPVTFR